MIKEFGGPSQWQEAMTQKWIDNLLAHYSHKKLLILEGQVNLQFIKNACAKHKFDNYRIVLIDCDDAVRHERLRANRNQPELVNADMDNWARFLRNQANQMQVTILDTGKLNIDQITQQILKLVNYT